MLNNELEYIQDNGYCVSVGRPDKIDWDNVINDFPFEKMKGMMMKTLVELVKENCNFVHFVDNELWYETESGFQFPIPLKDVGTTLFVAEYKGIRLMKWIREHLKMIETEKIASLA